MEHILVPMDFSEAAQVGLHKAIEIASSNNSEIHLINIVSPPSKTRESDLAHAINELKESEEKLSALIHNIDNKGVTIHPEIKLANFEKGIIKYLDKNHIDLIVVGINGAHTVGDLFCLEGHGKCIKVNCPVEVVKQQPN